MQKANSYEQWASAGFMLDRLEGCAFPSPNSGRDEWKNHELSHDYDYELLKDRLQTLRDMRKKGDISAMIFNLRTTLSRNLGDMGNEKVFCAPSDASFMKTHMSEPRR